MTDTSVSTDTRETSEALIRRRVQAAMAMDVEAMAALYDDDVLFENPFHESGRTEPGAFGSVQGKAAVVAKFAGSAKVFDQIRFEDVDIVGNHDGTVVFMEARGDMRMKSGGALRNRYIFRFDIKNGKIVRVREYTNPVTAALALGRPIGPQ